MMDSLARGFEGKLRERRAKRISSDSDALLMILSEIDDTYRTQTICGVATLRHDQASYTSKPLSDMQENNK